MTDAPARGSSTRRELVEAALLAVLAYLPFLASSPGRVSSDSKQALYVDPGGFLVDAAYLWDPSVGAGTVPHQHLGYLWPTAPWFWAFDAVGVPDWVAQRLWVGSLTFAALLGARWLARSLGLGPTAAMVAALVYGLTPYQLAFTARTSVLLLPWAGLPWLVELTRRALARGGWRHPALFALVTFTVAGVNAPSLLLTGLAPLAVLVVAVWRDPARWRHVAGTALRIGAITIPACAWWLAGLRLQGTYGLPILQLTENLETVATRSSPDDVLRGLGNWFFYGADASGWSIDQAPTYLDGDITRMATFALPAMALAAAVVLRWRDRSFAALLVVGAAVVAVGAWPFANPSWWGRAFRSVADGTSVGLAFRNSPRIVPVLVLGMALLLAAAVAAAHGPRRTAAAVAVGLVAIAGLAAPMRAGMLSSRVDRPAELPAYWHEAADHLDGGDPDTRVLEVPGANFAAYRWGNAIEPITPLLIDRPFATREVLPQGSAASALLVDALDRRIQDGTIEPAAVAPVARLLGAGDIVVRNDLEYERFGLVAPPDAWRALVLAPDVELDATFGDPARPAPSPRLAPLGPTDLAQLDPPRVEELPMVGIFSVVDPEPIVGAHPLEGAVVLAGDAEGIVDAAGLDVIDGHQVVLLSGALSDAQLAEAVADGGRLVITDTNRRRAQSWFSSITDTRGATERAGETIVEPSGYDARLEAFDSDDDARSVAIQSGATATATSSGGTARPEDRPSAAIDGRTATAWRIGGADPTGEHLRIELDEQRDLDALTLVQPQDGPRDRVITTARISLDGAAPVEVDLDERSLRPEGQAVAVAGEDVSTIDIEIAATSDPGFDPAFANAVGFAEVGIDGVQASESIRLPIDLADRVGPDSEAVPLDLVLTRLRAAPARWQRNDQEVAMDRTFRLPTERTFALSGTARPATDAPGPLLDELLGTDGDVTVSGSSTLDGDAASRPSRVLDGTDRHWSPSLRDGAPHLHFDGSDLAVDALELDVVVDGRHSIPTEVAVLVDGEEVARQELDVPTGGEEATIETVAMPLDAPLEGDAIELRFEGIEPTPTVAGDPASTPLPIAIAEVRAEGLPAQPDPEGAGGRGPCRDDLVTVDGAPIEVRIGPLGDDGTLEVQGCEDLVLAAGDHRLQTVPGSETGVDLDGLRLASDADGGEPGGGEVEVVQTSTDRTTTRTEVDPRGEPFWYVLGQSDNAGWEVRVDGGSAGPRTLVDGYSSGWLITPDGDGPVTVHARWAPQRTVWVAMGISVASILAALAIVVASRPGRGATAGAAVDPPRFLGLHERLPATTVGPAIAAGAVTAVAVATFGRPAYGVAAGLAAAATARWPRAIWALAVAAPATLVASRVADRPELAWLALGWVVAALAADVVRSRARR